MSSRERPRGAPAPGAPASAPISVDAHLRAVLDAVTALPVETAPLGAAIGRVLAADVVAGIDLPLWDNSAMDGYAVRAVDTAGASEGAPVRLAVIGEVAAGHGDDPQLSPGAAVRIMTGAPLPSSADAVVPVEQTRAEGEPGDWAEHRVTVLRAAQPGAHVRRRGEDVVAGERIASAGEQLGARRAAAIAAAGVSEVRVRPRPSVAVITTGSELRSSGAPLERGQIPESNSVLLAALLAEDGIEPVSVAVSDDDASGLAARLARIDGRVDAVITTGGVGPGLHDVVRIALAAEPGVRAVRVAVKPGQPQCFGRLRGGSLIFALPGNPVSAAVSYELFVRPALRHLQGASRLHRPRVPATVDSGWRGSADRTQVLPVRVRSTPDGLRCAPAVEPRGYSHAVGRHGAAEGYAIVEPGRGDVAAGETVETVVVAW
ncbi:molybdopterin molybdotransferase MoeA [Leucobacter chromiiresistens]|uniref:molybdopterin molybdotransferase MoeA n=1 Tax=Leucobacter chromiiresistens TaxID=1079994 RepID=UPI0007348C7A|nr:gephyrin-like molybdotransferase Glp [Leucobacter chromiiresistens]